MLEILPGIGFSIIALAPVSFLWARGVRRRIPFSPFRWFGLAVALVTLSAVLFAAANFSPVLGADYSTRRYAVIYSNVALGAIALCLAARGSHDLRSELVTAGVIVLVLWLYLGLANTAV